MEIRLQSHKNILLFVGKLITFSLGSGLVGPEDSISESPLPAYMVSVEMDKIFSDISEFFSYF